MFQKGGGIELLIRYNLGLKQYFGTLRTLSLTPSPLHTQDCAP